MGDYREFALRTAQKAGKLLMDNYGKMQQLSYKLKTNFKTQVDDRSDKLIRDAIAENFPNHNIYSEESHDKKTDAEFSWIIDPLDGTLPYTFGISDHFSVSIALVKDKVPIVGVIYAPKRGELYVAEQGKGAFCNNSPVHVAAIGNINKAMIGVDYGKLEREKITCYHRKLLSENGVTYPISYGCASISLALVASGKLHGYLALKLEPWDMAAAVVLIREAGGKVTTIEGKDWKLGHVSILTANSKLHNELLSFLRS